MSVSLFTWETCEPAIPWHSASLGKPVGTYQLPLTPIGQKLFYDPTELHRRLGYGV